MRVVQWSATCVRLCRCWIENKNEYELDNNISDVAHLRGALLVGWYGTMNAAVYVHVDPEEEPNVI